MKNIDWVLIRSRLLEAVLVLPNFMRNPVQTMRQLPDWDWPTILILQGALAASCAFLSNLIEKDWTGMITGPILMPIFNYLMLTISSGFFFYTFMFLFKRDIPFRQIYIHVLFASIPSTIVSMIAGFVPPIVLIGASASLMLLYVSCVDQFGLDRDKVKKLLLTLLVIYTVFWALQVARISSRKEHLRQKATPESLDILENEMNFNN